MSLADIMIPKESCSDVDVLTNWIESSQKSWKFADQQVKISELETGRGLIAEKNFDYGDVICSIPYSLAITCSTVRRDPMISEIIDNLHRMDRMSYKELFILFLVLHKRLGEDSKYFVYLQSLPVNYTNPSLWTDIQIKRLSPTLQKLVGVERQMLQDSRRKLNKWMEKPDRVRLNQSWSPKTNLDSINQDDFNWAYTSF